MKIKNIPAFIGEGYRYPGSKTVFTLLYVSGFIYRFNKDHWCTDDVFESMIRVRTGRQVYEENQIEIEFAEENGAGNPPNERY